MFEEYRESRTESLGVANKKEWRPPELRKLPIAATAQGAGKIVGHEDDGNCHGKGEVLNTNCS